MYIWWYSGWIATFYVRIKVDIFPEKYQAACVGIVEFIGNCGKTIAPYVINFANEHKSNPIFFVNIFRSTIGTLPIIFLLEKRISLETIDEVDENEKSDKLWCLHLNDINPFINYVSNVHNLSWANWFDLGIIKYPLLPLICKSDKFNGLTSFRTSRGCLCAILYYIACFCRLEAYLHLTH